jgi:hypothetical protein
MRPQKAYFNCLETTLNCKLLSATKIAQALDISVVTLTNWYKWYKDANIKKPDNVPVLPGYYQEHDRGPRMWKETDIKALKDFQQWIPKGRGGLMGKVSSQYWGKRSSKNKN